MSRRLSLALSATLLATLAVSAPAHADTTITDLGGLPGLPEHWATSINDAGDVVGAASHSSEPDRAVRFGGDGTASEVTGPAGSSAIVNAINNRGVAAGTSAGRAIRFDADGTRVRLAVPFGYSETSGRAVDDFGAVYGHALGNGKEPIPVRWRPNGIVTSMKLPQGATTGFVQGASANGYVAGWADGPGMNVVAVRWNPDGSVTELPRMAPGAASSATAVNSLGEVVGNANTENDQATFGVHWGLDGSFHDYGQGSMPRSINDHGVAVGSYSADGLQHPFRWERDGEKLELGRPDGVSTAEAFDINNDGVIVGRAGSRAVKWVVS